MKIKLLNAGKRFNREWIFRNAEMEFNIRNCYAITGPNGSGKSTFLQTIAGMAALSEGSIHGTRDDHFKKIENIYQHFSFCAPYVELIEELTLKEFLDFQKQFKPFLKGISQETIISSLGLEKAVNKQIRFYSSGMKQKVKLAQAIFSNTSILLLDEPCTNLDAKGIEWYHQLMDTYSENRLVIICSNDEVEYSFCNHIISMLSFKDKIIL
ncbi:MAG: hypothetical protein NVS1B13_12320 [Flavisolibacter sp.]